MEMDLDRDRKFLLEALALAEIRRGETAPNPAVGAVVVKDSEVLSRGFHKISGQAHAEVEALKALGDEAVGATIYVSLEPCCFVGKTPACTELLKARRVSRVVYAFEDPNPKVKGHGKATLINSGIKVDHLPLPEGDSFYESYRYWTNHRLPFVIAKLSQSLDGVIAAEDGSPIRITGEEVQRFTHESRKRANAILTTSRTVLLDNPKMNVRLTETPGTKDVFVLDTSLKIPPTAQIFKTSRVTLLHGPQGTIVHSAKFVEVKSAPPHLDLENVLETIGGLGYHELWVEAGGQLFENLLRQHLVQRAYLYVAPRILGKGRRPFSQNLKTNFENARVSWFTLGQDSICEINWNTN